jgi:hypothetical protein
MTKHNIHFAPHLQRQTDRLIDVRRKRLSAIAVRALLGIYRKGLLMSAFGLLEGLAAAGSMEGLESAGRARTIRENERKTARVRQERRYMLNTLKRRRSRSEPR